MWMATVASRAVVRIARDLLVVVIRLVLIVMRMTVEAAERTVIPGDRMALRARIPLVVVSAAIDPEMLSIMIER